MIADIYFLEFLKADLSGVGGGGIGTLIMHLIPVLQACGLEVRIFQCSQRQFKSDYNGVPVVGIPLIPGKSGSNEQIVQTLREIAAQSGGSDDRVEIFAADFFSVWNRNPLAIAVQNGIAWDAPFHLERNKIECTLGWKEHLNRWRCQERGLRRFERCYNRVAVDLYFLNWYRSFRGPDYPGRVFYNPNPAPVMAWNTERENRNRASDVRIIMARRMVPEKGTRLAAKVVKRLLSERNDVQVTFAGEGSDRQFLMELFAGEKRVDFTVFKPEEAAQINQKYDIAIIPSLCGEATCLAVLEAMAAGCAVVATNMGGTITQIFDGYNGKLCWPTEEDLFHSILYLVDNSDRRITMAKRGWEISQSVFPLSMWQKNWKIIISEVLCGRDHALQDLDRNWRPAVLERLQHCRIGLRKALSKFKYSNIKNNISISE